ncbi:MAG: hypothetical protein ABIH89_10160 [Elusimicrobiota bacterium]
MQKFVPAILVICLIISAPGCEKIEPVKKKIVSFQEKLEHFIKYKKWPDQNKKTNRSIHTASPGTATENTVQDLNLDYNTMLTSITITAAGEQGKVIMAPGESIELTAMGFDFNGSELSIKPEWWTTTGALTPKDGSITVIYTMPPDIGTEYTFIKVGANVVAADAYGMINIYIKRN